MTVVMETQLTSWPVRRGKVRDVYDLGDKLLLIATDRISAFDWVMPAGIPDKGRLLTQISLFWFRRLKTPHHVLTDDLSTIPFPAGTDVAALVGRSLVVCKAEVVPVECVVRGYLEGSGWKEYQRNQAVCGVPLPAGLQQGSQLPKPIFTPATKEESGHDENITFAQMGGRVGIATAEELRRRSIDLYQQASDYARERGVIIADTKFEWGRTADGLILIDEALTPDSSRFWPADRYRPGGPQVSFDKQFIREWLETTGWDKNSPPPPLPDEVVQKTRAKYIEAYERIVGQPFGAR